MRLPDCTRKRWLLPIAPWKFSLVHMWVIPILERKGRQRATTLGCGLGPGVVNSGQLSKRSRELVAQGLRLCHGAGHGGGSHSLVGRGLLPPWCCLRSGKVWGRVWHPHAVYGGQTAPLGDRVGAACGYQGAGRGRRTAAAKLVETAPGEAPHRDCCTWPSKDLGTLLASCVCPAILTVPSTALNLTSLPYCTLKLPTIKHQFAFLCLLLISSFALFSSWLPFFSKK